MKLLKKQKYEIVFMCSTFIIFPSIFLGVLYQMLHVRGIFKKRNLVSEIDRKKKMENINSF